VEDISAFRIGRRGLIISQTGFGLYTYFRSSHGIALDVSDFSFERATLRLGICSHAEKTDQTQNRYNFHFISSSAHTQSGSKPDSVCKVPDLSILDFGF
jgi:hypothetical protein